MLLALKPYLLSSPNRGERLCNHISLSSCLPMSEHKFCAKEGRSRFRGSVRRQVNSTPGMGQVNYIFTNTFKSM